MDVQFYLGAVCAGGLGAHGWLLSSNSPADWGGVVNDCKTLRLASSGLASDDLVYILALSALRLAGYLG